MPQRRLLTKSVWSPLSFLDLDVYIFFKIFISTIFHWIVLLYPFPSFLLLKHSLCNICLFSGEFFLSFLSIFCLFFVQPGYLKCFVKFRNSSADLFSYWGSQLYFLFHLLSSSVPRFLFGSFYDPFLLTEFLIQIMNCFPEFCWTIGLYSFVSLWVPFWILF
jgi:hypothetical protein